MNSVVIASFVSDWLEPWQVQAALRMMVTIALAGAIGLEREIHGREAGLRTHMLVGLGCCLIMLVSLDFERSFSSLDVNHSIIRIDPARMAYGAVTGIGFLGAGVIVKTGTSVHGLTTAASLWCVSALGLALGMGMYKVALLAGILMLIALTVLNLVGAVLPKHHYHRVQFDCGLEQDLSVLRDRLQSAGATVLSMRLIQNIEENLLKATYRLRFTGKVNTPGLLRSLRNIPGLKCIEIV